MLCPPTLHVPCVRQCSSVGLMAPYITFLCKIGAIKRFNAPPEGHSKILNRLIVAPILTLKAY